MKKNIAFLAGILCLALALTGCAEKDPEISITNASQFPIDDNATVRIFKQGRWDTSIVQPQTFSRNETVSFSLEPGEYRVVIQGGRIQSFSFPQDGSHMYMVGEIRLRFDGSEIRRTN